MWKNIKPYVYTLLFLVWLWINILLAHQVFIDITTLP